MSQTLLFVHASEIVDGRTAVRDHALAVRDGSVIALAPQTELTSRFHDAERVDCSGQVLTPGFVDSHTHAVFGKWRAAEYELRSRGLDYMEIARRGGGINASVLDVRRRSEDELVESALARLHVALRHGTTTVEIKSGYGLSVADELKLLRVIRRVSEHTVLEIVPTFLGAHDVPLEYRDRRADYVALVTDQMIPVVAQEKLAVFCDVFMEPGAFTASETRAILTAGARHGLIPKLHADEFENSGAAELAAELGAASADHLGAISAAGIAALAASATVATLLPATLFFLGKKSYAPARKLIDAGATIALATDFNPGTAPSASLPLVLTLACSQMQLTPLEAIAAATAGGARALRLEDVGSLAPGARADIVAWRAGSHVEIPYHFDVPPLAAVWKAGRRVI
ncbi:MAG: imidazolonepropionase [Gemmatimonadota bacterium]